MANQESKQPDRKDPLPSPETDLQLELASRFKPFLALYGSVAAVSAFLLFAGFLSDFGAYRIAGLPRLSFSFTALVETGSDVAVDMLSLLAQGTRAFWLTVLLGAVILTWSAHRHPRVSRWATSKRLYYWCRLALLMLAFVVFASLVDRTQRSLAGEMHTAGALERGLTEAYADKFPDPHERQRAIDRQGYELRFYRLPNWATAGESGWRWVKSWMPWLDADRLEGAESGIVLRALPESRRDARHVFGWLAFTVLALLLAAVLLQWWRQGLRATDGARRPVPMRWWDDGMDPAIDSLVVPLTSLLLGISVLLLPLAHGVLAKKSLGGEHVMVYLKPPASPSTEELTADKDGKSTETKRERSFLHPEPSALMWPGGRFDCKADTLDQLSGSVAEHNEALRDLTQERKAESDAHREAFTAYVERLDAVAGAVVGVNCADAVRQFWAIKPPPGLAAQEPEIAESYRRAAARVATAYGLRIGTILTYPRDTQPLTLVDSIVPRNTMQSPAWSLQAIDASLVSESVVLPDMFRRGMEKVGEILQVEPDNDAIAELLVAPSSEALEVVLPLLRGGRLFANGRGVSVTALGSMAWISAVEKPNLSRDAINLLADLTSTAPTAFWPNKDGRARGAAVTALHLTRSPYAGHLLGQQVSAAGPEQCNASQADGSPSIACIPQTSTAAGYLLQDLAAEARRFSAPERVPASLQAAREDLQAFISDLVATDGVAEDVRGAACTAIGLAGGIAIRDAKRKGVFLERLKLEHLGDFPMSAGACLLHAQRVGLDESQLRPVLRRVALAHDIRGYSTREAVRVRYAAFAALNNMGLSGETDTVMQLYMTEPSKSRLAEAAESRITELTEAHVIKFILECAGNAQRPTDERQRCLKAIQHTKKNMDGDEGTANALLALLRSPELSKQLHAATCDALKVFVERKGRVVLQLKNAEDPTLLACLQSSKPEEEAQGNEHSDKLRELLQRMLREGKQPSPASEKSARAS